MDNRRYCKVENGQIVKYNQSRKDFGVGLNSDEATCSDKGYYLVIDDKPDYDTATQKQGGNDHIIDEVAKTVTKTYNIVDIPLEELQAAKNKLVETSVQNLLDTSAREAGYDSIISACSYVGSTNFGVEAQSFLNWRDAVWTYVFQVQADILAQLRTEPTLAELMAELPARV